MRIFTEEYANGGLSELEKIVNSSDDDDIIFKHLFELIKHTLRSNFFINKSSDHTAISIKLDTSNIKFNKTGSYNNKTA